MACAEQERSRREVFSRLVWRRPLGMLLSWLCYVKKKAESMFAYKNGYIKIQTMTIKFDGYDIQPQWLRTDKSVRVNIEVSKDQLEKIQDILLMRLPEGIYEITIEPKVEES
jgi:hypothetical protein